MSTDWRDFGDGTYALLGGSNIGVIVREGRAVMVDAGLDRSVSKKALRQIEALGARLEAIVLTHGHADHFGGAGWLAERGVPVYAPPLEGVFAAQPLLEPLFLYGGAAPIAELRGKFTLAEEAIPRLEALGSGALTLAGIPLELIPLPGHSPAQMGVACGETFYCGDVVFPQMTLARHPILFCADLDAWLETLAVLPRLPFARFVPGHGEPAADITPLAAANAARLREIRAQVWAALVEPREPAEVLRAVAAHFEASFTAPQFYFLALTTIHAALTSLQRAGEAAATLRANQLLWQRV